MKKLVVVLFCGVGVLAVSPAVQAQSPCARFCAQKLNSCKARCKKPVDGEMPDAGCPGRCESESKVCPQKCEAMKANKGNPQATKNAFYRINERRKASAQHQEEMQDAAEEAEADFGSH